MVEEKRNRQRENVKELLRLLKVSDELNKRFWISDREDVPFDFYKITVMGKLPGKLLCASGIISMPCLSLFLS
ncbi:hypothetical protein Nepgr_010277 [Nepenthes gracilis]|uniref:Uncharacterized protein n=1 Tax=Nepenthes gracilis TaxID=150966 RepID=A0AAD3SCB0_NEPGR|nr:hypothetical protein Nepgr_010277 [Nepenthes gracilis]